MSDILAVVDRARKEGIPLSIDRVSTPDDCRRISINFPNGSVFETRHMLRDDAVRFANSLISKVFKTARSGDLGAIPPADKIEAAVRVHFEPMLDSWGIRGRVTNASVQPPNPSYFQGAGGVPGGGGSGWLADEVDLAPWLKRAYFTPPTKPAEPKPQLFTSKSKLFIDGVEVGEVTSVTPKPPGLDEELEKSRKKALRLARAMFAFAIPDYKTDVDSDDLVEGAQAGLNHPDVREYVKKRLDMFSDKGFSDAVKQQVELDTDKMGLRLARAMFQGILKDFGSTYREVEAAQRDAEFYGLDRPDVSDYVVNKIKGYVDKAKQDAVESIIADTTISDGVATVRFKTNDPVVAEQQGWPLVTLGSSGKVVKGPLRFPGVSAVDIDPEDEDSDEETLVDRVDDLVEELYETDKWIGRVSDDHDDLDARVVVLETQKSSTDKILACIREELDSHVERIEKTETDLVATDVAVDGRLTALEGKLEAAAIRLGFGDKFDDRLSTMFLDQERKLNALDRKLKQVINQHAELVCDVVSPMEKKLAIAVEDISRTHDTLVRHIHDDLNR